MGFWSELKQAFKDGLKEGEQEIEAEEAAEEARRQARLTVDNQAALRRIEHLSHEEKFAMCLAAPWRAMLFPDLYSIHSKEAAREEKYSLYLYAFGNGADLTPSDVKNLRKDLKKTYGVSNREEAIGMVKHFLAEANIPMNSALFRPTREEFRAGFAPSRFMAQLDDPYMARTSTPLRVLIVSLIADVLTSGADVGHITKAEAMEALADVNRFVKSLLAADANISATWADFGELFLQGNAIGKLNKEGSMGFKFLRDTVTYLRDAPGSPWMNVPFAVEGEELLDEQELRHKGYGPLPELYEAEAFAAIIAHIETCLGHFEAVYQEVFSPDVRLDVGWIAPGPERDHSVAVTVGAGAYRMGVPQELGANEPCRMEVMIALPADWNIDDEGKWWPIAMLKAVGRFPIEHETWCGRGHSIQFDDDFSETQFVGCALTAPLALDPQAASCFLPDGDAVIFHQVLPLYRDEMQYQIDNGMEALMKKFHDAYGEDWDGVLDAHRGSVVTDTGAEPETLRYQ